MYPRLAKWLYSILSLTSFLLLVFFAICKIKGQDNLSLAIVIALSMLLTVISEWSRRKAFFFWQFSNTKNNLDGKSLRLLANTRGMPFTTLITLTHPGSDGLVIANLIDLSNDLTIRYLIGLKLIRVEVFPERLDFIYYLTNLGQYLLDKELGFPLYPESFCEMYRLRFWKGYKKHFLKKISQFERMNVISWGRSWDIFCDIFKRQLGGKELQIKEEDIAPSFDSYSKQKDFNSIVKEIVNPWKEQVKNEKRYKSFRLYFRYKRIFR